jgi:hypothetical protein
MGTKAQGMLGVPPGFGKMNGYGKPGLPLRATATTAHNAAQ